MIVFRVTFEYACTPDNVIDIQATDVITACQKALSHMRNNARTFKIHNITKVEVIDIPRMIKADE